MAQRQQYQARGWAKDLCVETKIAEIL